MRNFLAPACVFLISLTAPVGIDSKSPSQDFAGTRDTAKKIVARVTSDEGASNGKQIDDEPTDDDDVAVAAIGMPSQTGAIDIPQQGGLSDDALLALMPPPPKPAPVIVKPVMYRSREQVCDTLARAAESNDLPVPFFIRLLFQESRFKPGVVSSAGAQGIAQFMPETSESVGLDNPFDPLQAIPASARLLRSLVQQFGNLGLAAAAYNAGPKRVQDWLAKKSGRHLPEETQGYVKTITGKPVETWTVASAGVPARRLPRHAPCQEAAGLSAWNGPESIPTPLPSPRVQLASASGRAQGHAPIYGRSRVKIAHRGSRMVAVIDTGAAATGKKGKPGEHHDHGGKASVQQLAARQAKTAKGSKSAETHKHTREKIAQK
jgi:hypothetical protein